MNEDFADGPKKDEMIALEGNRTFIRSVEETVRTDGNIIPDVRKAPAYSRGQVTPRML